MLSAQIEHLNPDLLFTIRSEYIWELEKVGAQALEYYNGSLYLAFPEVVLVLDDGGNVINTIRTGTNDISDIVFLNGFLYVYSPQSIKQILVYKDNKLEKTLHVDFYASNREEITRKLSAPFYFLSLFLLNIDNDLYFASYASFISFSSLNEVNAPDLDKYKDINFYINSNRKRPIVGRPIRENEIVKWIFPDKPNRQNLNLKIINQESKEQKIISKKILETNAENKTFSVTSVFKNNYLDNYFVYGAWEVKNKSKPLGQRTTYQNTILLLDNSFNIKKVCDNLEYLQGKSGPSPWPEASFTSDEFGNIYYCTNMFDKSENGNSFVKIYKIDITK